MKSNFHDILEKGIFNRELFVVEKFSWDPWKSFKNFSCADEMLQGHYWNLEVEGPSGPDF